MVHRDPQHVQRSGVNFSCNGTENDISDCIDGVTVDHNCSSVSVSCRRNQFISKYLNYSIYHYACMVRCMCVCVCVRVYVCTCVRVYVCVRVHAYVFALEL